MPTLSFIMARTATAFGVHLDLPGALRSNAAEAVQTRDAFAWLATRLTDRSPDRIGRFLGWSPRDVLDAVDAVNLAKAVTPELRIKLGRLCIEIQAEAIAIAALKLPLPADPDPAHTAARLLAGDATAATVSEDALRGLALAFLALAASDTSPPVQEASNHG